MSLFNDETIDSSRWQTQRYLISGKPSTPGEVNIHTLSCSPPGQTKARGTILLIHGFPQTSFQFRRVITPLSDAGYHVLAPDYRGAGYSSKPRAGYDKATMAGDLHTLVTKHLGIKEPIHVVGHDIGGKVAHAYASQFPESTASVVWGECPLPGTSGWDKCLQEEIHGSIWHFAFHWQADVPEMLVTGRERDYLRGFFDRLAVQPLAIGEKDAEHYAAMYSQAGALRAAFDLYRAFHQDAEDNKRRIQEKGKCKVPCLTVNGEGSFLATIAGDTGREAYIAVEERVVPRSGHYIAEENPKDFVKHVLYWVEKHGTK